MTESDGERRVRFRYFVVIIGLVLVGPVVTLIETGTVNWLWLVAGAAIFGVVVGPFARTATADRINRLAGDGGSARRIFVILLMIAGVWLVVKVLQPSSVAFNSFIGGAMSAILAVTTLKRVFT